MMPVMNGLRLQYGPIPIEDTPPGAVSLISPLSRCIEATRFLLPSFQGDGHAQCPALCRTEEQPFVAGAKAVE